MEASRKTLKTTPLSLDLLRQIADHTGEKQYRVVERLAKQEIQNLSPKLAKQ